MSIGEELDLFLETNLKDLTTKERDIRIIKYFFGLDVNPWPTLQETAEHFNIGTRERVRQIIKAKAYLLYRDLLKNFQMFNSFP